jgi:hypothetical protein
MSNVINLVDRAIERGSAHDWYILDHDRSPHLYQASNMIRNMMHHFGLGILILAFQQVTSKKVYEPKKEVI